MLTTVAITVVAFFLIAGAMAVGVIFQKKSLRGSCGGADVVDCDGESLSCGACPNRAEHRARKARAAEMVREFTGSR
jgi:uncharacterized protein